MLMTEVGQDIYDAALVDEGYIAGDEKINGE